MMSIYELTVLVCLCVTVIVGPPVQKPVEEASQEDDGVDQLLYNRYLQEVVNILEQDPDFRKKLEDANASHIKTDEFARELDFVNHQVRQKLDEAKRREIKRLKDLIRSRDDMENEGGHHGHVNVDNLETFEIEDLKKLITKTTQDLEDIDKQRRKEFKTYEMQKEHERKESLNKMDEEHRKEAEKQHEDDVNKHKDHPKIHHPGSKDQFKEVWEEEDNLDPEDFNTNTFFLQHDLDGDGYWTEDEIEALFQSELEKLYEGNHTEDDMNEKFEEMYRMREHLVGEMDKDNDKSISRQEYEAYVSSKEFDKDEGWETIDEKPQYTDEEYLEYERMMAEDNEKMKAQGLDGLQQPGVIHPDGKVEEMERNVV